MNTLIEYFYVFGPNPQQIMNNEYYNENKFDKKFSLECKLISQFPPYEKPSANLNENIIMSHIFPSGYYIIESISQPKEEIVHFDLENISFMHTNNKRVYYTALIFYEKLSYYYQAYEKINEEVEIEKKELRENTLLSSNKRLFDTYYIPKAITFSSLMSFPNEFKNLILRVYNYSLNKNIDSTLDDKYIYPIEKIIEGLVLKIPRPVRGQFYLTIKNTHAIINNSKEKDIKFLISGKNEQDIPSFKLQSIFEFNDDDIIEIFKDILLEIPVLFFCKDKEKLTNIVNSFLILLQPFQYPYLHISILPDINAGIIENSKTFVLGVNREWGDPSLNLPSQLIKTKNYFDLMNIKVINKAIRICDVDNKCLFLYYKKSEEEGHIISLNDIGKEKVINEVNEEKTEQIQTNVNNNTANQNQLQNKPTIFITPANLDKINTEEQKKVVNVIENKETTEKLIKSSLEINHEFNNDAINCKLPLHYTKKLKIKLANLEQKTKECEEYVKEINKRIVDEIFYYFLVSLFKNYNNYLYTDKKEIVLINKELFTKHEDIKIEKLFKTALFLDENSDNEFYKLFFETQTFKNFLIRKYNNKENDKFTFLLFDESIIKKRNRNYLGKKIQIPFSSDKSLEQNIPIEIENVSIFNEQENLQVKKNKYKLLNYYQKVVISKNKISFSYYVFPKLIYDNKIINYNLTIENILKKTSVDSINQQYKEFRKKLEQLDKKEYFQIYQGGITVTSQYLFNPNKAIYNDEIENSITLLWLRIFAMTFYYATPEEKLIRFYEMIDNFNHLGYVKDDILSIIYLAIYKYGEDFMLIQLFEILYNFFNKNVYYLHYALLIDKVKNEFGLTGKLKKLSLSNTHIIIPYFTEFYDEELHPQKITQKLINSRIPRTYKISDDKNIKDKENILGKEIVRFDNYLSCSSCRKSSDITRITMSYDIMNKFDKLTCPSCKVLINLNTRVRIYDTLETINLIAPYYLYSITSSQILNIFGNKLDFNELRKSYPNFFWNCIWYFNLRGLSFDMLLKYKEVDKKEMMKAKEIINKENMKNVEKIKKRKKHFANSIVCHTVSESVSSAQEERGE